MEIPPCRYRGASNERGRFPCTSSFFVVGHEGITAEHCERCPVPDKVPSEPLPKVEARPLPQDPLALGKRYLLALHHERLWLANGGRMPLPTEIAERTAICNACERRDSDDRCTLCGCYLHSRLLHIPPILHGQTQLSTQICPLRTWGTV